MHSFLAKDKLDVTHGMLPPRQMLKDATLLDIGIFPSSKPPAKDDSRVMSYELGGIKTEKKRKRENSTHSKHSAQQKHSKRVKQQAHTEGRSETEELKLRTAEEVRTTDTSHTSHSHPLSQQYP